MPTDRHYSLRPTQYAEQIIVTSILNGTYPPGSLLPAERVFAEQLGVTRPTLRETLQRLASEGWVTIQHGKQTVVNDCWKEGGLRMLGTTAKFGKHLPKEFISHLLEVRVTMFPAVTRRAVQHAPEVLVEYLSDHKKLDEDPEAFARYDWGLQLLIARESRNPIYLLILNDFASIFNMMAPHYFSLERGRTASHAYYENLLRNIMKGGGEVEDIVRDALAKSIIIWSELKV